MGNKRSTENENKNVDQSFGEEENYCEIYWFPIIIVSFFFVSGILSIVFDPSFDVVFQSINFTVCLGSFFIIEFFVDVKLSESEHKIQIRRHPFYLYQSTIKLDDVISIKKEEGDEFSWNPGYNYKSELNWKQLTYNYIDKISIYYSENGNRKRHDLFVKHPDRLYHWLNAQIDDKYDHLSQPSETGGSEGDGQDDVRSERVHSIEEETKLSIWRIFKNVGYIGGAISMVLFILEKHLKIIDLDMTRFVPLMIIASGILLVLGIFGIRKFEQE